MLQLTEYQRERLELITHKLKFVSEKPLVACIEGPEPLTPAGLYMDELVALAGGLDLGFPDGQDVYTTILEKDPDIIVILPETGSAISNLSLMPVLLQLPDFGKLKAVKNNRLYIVNSDFYTCETLDLVDMTELLAEMIWPKQFIFGYEGNEWIKFEM